MVYSEARRLSFLSLSQRLTTLYALERESNLGSTFAVLIELSQERDVGSDLCRAYGISRPTAYRWINRYNESGPEGPMRMFWLTQIGRQSAAHGSGMGVRGSRRTYGQALCLG